MNKLRDFIALALYCGFIYWLSAQESLPVPQIFTLQDKLEHAGAYFVMSLLAWRYFRHWLKCHRMPFLIAVGFCSFYGATDEWHQSFVIGRTPDILDWLADSMGAGLAMWGLYQFKFKNEVKNRTINENTLYK